MISFPIGPIAGGYLLDHFWWGSVFLINIPVVLIALAAVALLVPESRSSRRPTVDYAGLVVSSAGLTGLTYGFIKAGQDGWGDATALVTMVAGALLLVAFVWLERRIAAGPRSPLVDLPLFRLAGFRWGTILATAVSFAMFGLLFAMPQYFQEIRGADALGSGIRLLPLVGGMLVGMIGSTRVQSPRKGRSSSGGAPPRTPRGVPDGKASVSDTQTGEARPPLAGARPVVAIGYFIMAAAMAGGALTTLSSSLGYSEAWVTIAGIGLGMALPSSMNIALGDLSAERSGSGSALISALRQVGGTIGVAVLGTLISNGYSSGLRLRGLPDAAASVARKSVTGGVAVAEKLGSAALLDNVRAAFVHGMDSMLWTCGGIALVAALLAVAFLPRASAARATRATAGPLAVPGAEGAQSST
jgi:hypothetical protein